MSGRGEYGGKEGLVRRGSGTGEKIKNKMTFKIMVERSRVDKEEMNNFDDSDKMAMVVMEKEEFNDCDRRHIDDKIEGGDQDDGGEEEL